MITLTHIEVSKGTTRHLPEHPVEVDPRRIQRFYSDNIDNGGPCTVVETKQATYLFVKETPEEIANRIKAAIKAARG